MHSILCNNTEQGTVQRGEKKKVKVSFLNYNEREEEERQQRGVQLRARLKDEIASYKKMAHNIDPRRVYAALTNPSNILGLNTLAANSESFRMVFFAFFGHVAAMPNESVNGQPNDALGALNALIAASISFPNLVGVPDIMDCLYMIGALPAMQPFFFTSAR